MNVRELTDAEHCAMSFIAEKPDTAFGLRKRLVRHGFSDEESRNAIAWIWDSGYVNIGLDQIIRSVPTMEYPDQ